ncbi:glutamate-5-semialdehyde dehydrogenase [Candidatus Gracilibacteria bacterium]|nr:glutamate-5-semialdehyde dehydrogenase [Candidatus Gracilibacteria bacterium]
MNTILPLLEKTKSASREVAMLSDSERAQLILDIAQNLEENREKVLEANARDAEKMEDSDPKKDRLLLNEARIQSIASDARNIASLPDPTGKVLLSRTLENGIELQKVTVPLGVVGVIYESRPNVTVDVAVLALRSGNAVILRGGSDAEASNTALVAVIHDVLRSKGIDENAVQLLPTDRAFVQELLEAEKYVDVLIPRGSQNLIQFVREHARIPTIETGAGVCHTFVESSADLEKAKAIVLNAKLQRPSVCNALDTILVSQDIAQSFLPMLVNEFRQAGVEIFADEISFSVLQEAGYSLLQKASESDFGREFLGLKCSIKVVDSFDDALVHIARYSSRHSESIVSENKDLCDRFLREVDVAAVYSNASTRFTDGSVFGLGAEIGISTQKLHARGPFALEALVTQKWILRGDGQVRQGREVGE